MAVVYFFGFVAVLGGVIYGAIFFYERWLSRQVVAGHDDVATPMVGDDGDEDDTSILLSPGYQHSPSRGVGISTEYHLNV